MMAVLRRCAYWLGSIICLGAAYKASPDKMIGGVSVTGGLAVAAFLLIAVTTAESIPALVKLSQRQERLVAVTVGVVGGTLVLGPLIMLLFTVFTIH